MIDSESLDPVAAARPRAPKTCATPGDAHLLRRIVETDRRYFEMGGAISPLPGGQLAWIPGLAHCPSSVVVQRVSAAAIVRQGAEWVRLVEDRLRELGAPSARIYLDGDDPAAAAVLEAAGYEMRRETALSTAAAVPAACDIELREVTSSDDWRRKLRFHETVIERPDGHDSAGADWLRLEQAKSLAGMRAFLAWRGDDVVGAIGAIASDRLWRLKNIVVHADHRRQSVGRGMIARIGGMAAQAGASTLCLFGVERTPGEALYRACGFTGVGFQVEWSKHLSQTAPG